MLNNNPASAAMGDFKEPISDLYSGGNDVNNSWSGAFGTGVFARDGTGVEKRLNGKQALIESGDGTGDEGRDIVNETVGEW